VSGPTLLSLRASGCSCCTSRNNAPGVPPDLRLVAEKLSPPSYWHDLKVAFQRGVQFRAVYNHSLPALVRRLLLVSLTPAVLTSVR